MQCCTRMRITLCWEGTVAWDLKPGHDTFGAVLPPQDPTLSDVISTEWQPSGLLSCTGLTALRLHECYGNEYIPAAEVKDYRFYSKDLPATVSRPGSICGNFGSFPWSTSALRKSRASLQRRRRCGC